MCPPCGLQWRAVTEQNTSKSGSASLCRSLGQQADTGPQSASALPSSSALLIASSPLCASAARMRGHAGMQREVKAGGRREEGGIGGTSILPPTQAHQNLQQCPAQARSSVPSPSSPIVEAGPEAGSVAMSMPGEAGGVGAGVGAVAKRCEQAFASQREHAQTSGNSCSSGGGDGSGGGGSLVAPWGMGLANSSPSSSKSVP